ncbi:MAG: 16S ribosomal RNA methyltransferase KsgA/Dim1 family protein [Methanosaeta sp. PtaU1.Bin112]|nr:MAG: 16S ribosomal RNA methyltransferase KsgA/Dim1 family protein [Methanosaeta sp. PtaU1.Bin112]
MIDWNSVWKLALLASRDGRLENGYKKEEAAERYDRSEIARQDGVRRTAALEIDPGWSVLDIGAGPGTLTLPLARRAKQVTAVEPSSAMGKRLEKHIAEERICNIRILPKWLEDLTDEVAGRSPLRSTRSLMMVSELRKSNVSRHSGARRIDQGVSVVAGMAGLQAGGLEGYDVFALGSNETQNNHNLRTVHMLDFSSRSLRIGPYPKPQIHHLKMTIPCENP